MSKWHDGRAGGQGIMACVAFGSIPLKPDQSEDDEPDFDQSASTTDGHIGQFGQVIEAYTTANEMASVASSSRTKRAAIGYKSHGRTDHSDQTALWRR